MTDVTAEAPPAAYGMTDPRRAAIKRAIIALANGGSPKGFNEDETALLRYMASRLTSLRVEDPYTWLANIWYGEPGHVCNGYRCPRDACVARFRLEENTLLNPYILIFKTAAIKDRLFDALHMLALHHYDFYNRYATLPHLERKSLVDEYSWAIPNDAALRAIAAEGPVIEVGAGAGYWAYCLRAMGADVIATDPDPAPSSTNTWCKRSAPWTALEKLTAVKAARRYSDRTLFLCWPPIGGRKENIGNYASRAVKAYHRAGGKTVIYVGERGDGCTGSFDESQWTREREVEIPQWPGLHDDLTIWRRK